jgi:hypothetical protein
MVFLPRGTGEEDIAAYKINPSSHNTVLLWKEGTVRQNFVDVDSAALPQVQKAVDAMLQQRFSRIESGCFCGRPPIRPGRPFWVPA